MKVQSLEDEPILHRHLHWVWKAFTDLNFRRGVAAMSGALPITYSDIHAYCLLKGIYSLHERERLTRFLDALDRHWIANHYEKQKKSMETPQNQPLSPQPRTPGRKSSRKPVS